MEAGKKQLAGALDNGKFFLRGFGGNNHRYFEWRRLSLRFSQWLTFRLLNKFA